MDAIGILFALAVGIVAGWIACRIHDARKLNKAKKAHGMTPEARASANAAVKAANLKPANRDKWPTVDPVAIPELREPLAPKEPKTPKRVGQLRAHRGVLLELCEMNGLRDKAIQAIEEVDQEMGYDK